MKLAALQAQCPADRALARTLHATLISEPQETTVPRAVQAGADADEGKVPAQFDGAE
jgi:hypothetical protein